MLLNYSFVLFNSIISVTGSANLTIVAMAKSSSFVNLFKSILLMITP